MALHRITTIPGLKPDSERVLTEAINSLSAEIAALRRPPSVTGLKNDGHFATEGSVVRLRGGQRVALPRARTENAGARIVVIVEVAGAISITAHRGFVNGARIQTLSDVGAYEFFSNGVDGWYLQGSLPGTSSGASALDAEYLVGAAHGSLPSARVATDSTEIDADLTVANVVSWALRTASVAFAKLADLPGLSVLGRAANSAGVMAAITATAARQTLRVNDAGTALAWGFPIEGQSASVDQGDAHTINVANGDGVNVALAIAAGVATITPTIDVGDFAGTGLENDGSNNLRIATAAAGAGLTGGGGVALAVGAGTNVTVNANDVSVTNYPLSGLAAQNARTVVANATNASAAPTAVQGTTARHVFRVNDAATALEWGFPLLIEQNNVSQGDAYLLDFQNGTNTTVTASTSAGQAVVQVSVDNYPLSGLADQAGNTIVANATASSAAPTALAISINSFPARLGTNLVSHPFSTLAGAGLTYASGALAVGAGDGISVAADSVAVDADSTRHIIADSVGVGFRKSRRRHFWFEDFDFVEEFEVGGFKQVHFGNTTWASEGTTGGDHVFIAGEGNHPGILRMTTSGALSSSATIFRGGDNAFEYMLAEDIYALEVVARIVTDTSVLVDFGFASDATGTVTDRIIFEFDTNSDTSVHTLTEEADTTTNNDTGFIPGTGWNVYTILQETPGTVEFYIDDLLETTHSTNVPDAEGVNVFARVLSRTANARSLDLDYVAFESQDLGARTS